MPTTFVKGDVFQEAAERMGPRALAIEADTSGAMDVGASVAFMKRWPAVAEAYAAHCSSGKVQLGDVFTSRTDALVVYVLALRKPGGKPTLSTLQRAARELVARLAVDAIPAVLLPRIAAGKESLDWPRVKGVLTEIGTETTADIVVFEQFVRKTPSAT